jgi:hypothetical protein
LTTDEKDIKRFRHPLLKFIIIVIVEVKLTILMDLYC